MGLLVRLESFQRQGAAALSAQGRSAAHSGNLGDILYSLPAARALGVSHYVLNCCHDPGLWQRQLSREGSRFLVPLLLAQPWIASVEITRVPVDLYGMHGQQVSTGIPLEHADAAAAEVAFLFDRFRLDPDVCTKHLIVSHADSVEAIIDEAAPYLELPGLARLRERAAEPDAPIVLSLTPRYRTAPSAFFAALLAGYRRVLKVGIPAEADAYDGIPGEFVTASDALELAETIASARLFIGAPSMPYAIAEGLKVPRVVDVCEALPNAYPLGADGWRMPSHLREARELVARLYGVGAPIVFQDPKGFEHPRLPAEPLGGDSAPSSGAGASQGMTDRLEREDQAESDCPSRNGGAPDWLDGSEDSAVHPLIESGCDTTDFGDPIEQVGTRRTIPTPEPLGAEAVPITPDRIVDLAAENRALRAEIAELLTSRSWRWSAPLRWVTTGLRRISASMRGFERRGDRA